MVPAGDVLPRATDVTSVRRRRLLATALAAAVGSVGCLGAGRRSAVPEGMTVETRHWTADLLGAGVDAGTSHALLASSSAVDERIDHETARAIEADEFLDGTAFETSYLLVVQHTTQSARWLELQAIERRERGVDVAIRTGSPDDEYGDDAVVHALAVRITDEAASVPEDVRVVVE